ncbi:PqqD family protein [Nocardioides campestrisoli]|uniref:PqqD family protein n=1 Tax=Nocardioides campestrisoli TaxID=2736757 RepID=UPI00163DB9BE|nr:PqqD family protein [Nocardioides campestrisoli]
MTAVDPGARPRRRLGIWLRRRRGALQIGLGDVALELSDAALVLFEGADGTRTVVDLAALLVAEYGIPDDEALADATEFLTSMVADGLMVVGADGASAPA